MHRYQSGSHLENSQELIKALFTKVRAGQEQAPSAAELSSPLGTGGIREGNPARGTERKKRSFEWSSDLQSRAMAGLR